MNRYGIFVYVRLTVSQSQDTFDYTLQISIKKKEKKVFRKLKISLIYSYRIINTNLEIFLNMVLLPEDSLRQCSDGQNFFLNGL